MRATKYTYLRVIQQHYGQGWEDVSEYTCNSLGIPSERNEKTGKSLLSHDLKEYRLMGYPTRVISRKQPN